MTYVEDPKCPFCVIMSDWRHPLKAIWPDAVAFEPLNPVTPGHTLVVPKSHVTKFDPNLRNFVGTLSSYGADYASKGWHDYNLIWNMGKMASQSIEHIHLHIVPRYINDGLHLPWTGQVT